MQLDKTYFRESFKGNHSKSAVFVMPRKAHKRTKALRRSGLSNEQICVATGVDDAGRAFLTVCGRGVISKERVVDALKPHIGKGTDVLTDGAAAYVKLLAELGANLTQTNAGSHAINRVNTLHARLEDFMFGFHGVSAKYLQAYLDWFRWFDAFTNGFGETDDDRLPPDSTAMGCTISAVETTSVWLLHTWNTRKSRMTSCIRCTVKNN